MEWSSEGVIRDGRDCRIQHGEAFVVNDLLGEQVERECLAGRDFRADTTRRTASSGSSIMDRSSE
jgi:hypothetical protein